MQVHADFYHSYYAWSTLMKARIIKMDLQLHSGELWKENINSPVIIFFNLMSDSQKLVSYSALRKYYTNLEFSICVPSLSTTRDNIQRFIPVDTEL